MTQPKFSQRERIAAIAASIIIGVIMMVTLYIITIDKNTVDKLIGKNISSSYSSSQIISSSNSEIASLIKSCTSQDLIKNFVPDQYYIDKYRDNNKVEVMSQVLADLSTKITANSAKVEKDRDVKYSSSNFDQFNTYFTSVKIGGDAEIYNRSRLELSDLMNNKITDAKTITFRSFVFQYYCGQLQTYTILSNSNRYQYSPGYLEFKTEQLNDLQPLVDEDFEKRVYTQAHNNFGPDINFIKMYEQYKNAANLY